MLIHWYLCALKSSHNVNRMATYAKGVLNACICTVKPTSQAVNNSFLQYILISISVMGRYVTKYLMILDIGGTLG